MSELIYGRKSDKKKKSSERIYINHVGFKPESYKSFVVLKPPVMEFKIFKLEWVKFTSVYKGKLIKGGEDLEHGYIGNFTEIKKEGMYQVRCGELKSRVFVIYPEVYDVPARVLLNYFQWQRCGNTGLGWNAPCHLKDGVIKETNEKKDFTGGYHQSGDMRKWAEFVVIGLIGLVEFKLLNSPHWDNGIIDEEIKWGSDYYQKLIKEDGSMYDSVFIPITWGPRYYYKTDPPSPALWNTSRYLALVSRYFKEKEPRYSKRCISNAEKIWKYMKSRENEKGIYNAPEIPFAHEGLNTWFAAFYKDSTLETSHSLFTAIELFKSTGNKDYLDSACSYADKLVNLQIDNEYNSDNPINACFWEGPGGTKMANSNFYFWSTSAPIALCKLLEIDPDYKNKKNWRDCIRNLADQHLDISGKNVWNRVPGRWFRVDDEDDDIVECHSFSQDNLDLEINRKYGGIIISREDRSKKMKAYYNYYTFLYNIDVIASGIFLFKAAKILNNKSCSVVAQKQLDWIMGCNPFDASSIEGVGYNQAHRGVFGEFFPPTPQIPGAVVTGLTENSFDPDGYGLDNEYDMPPTGTLMWLLSETGNK